MHLILQAAVGCADAQEAERPDSIVERHDHHVVFESVYDGVRNTNELYNCMAPLARLPQISLPLAQVDGVPIGLGLVAAHGNDELLLDIAVEIGA